MSTDLDSINIHLRSDKIQTQGKWHECVYCDFYELAFIPFLRPILETVYFRLGIGDFK